MHVKLYKNNKWIGDIILKNGRILANGQTALIYSLLLEMKTTKTQTNSQLIANLPKILHDNSSEFSAKCIDKKDDPQRGASASSYKKNPQVNKNTINAPENTVQEQYLSPRRHW